MESSTERPGREPEEETQPIPEHAGRKASDFDKHDDPYARAELERRHARTELMIARAHAHETP